MKKCISYILLLVFMVTVLSACDSNINSENNTDLYTQTYEVESFDLEQFTTSNGIVCKFEKNVGEIKDAKDAVAKAKQIWDEEFGMVNGKYYDPTGGTKVEICFDEENMCWLLMGTLPDNMFGTVPVAIIEADGDVIAVYMP